MAWYVFEASHGPGHQGHSIDYVWLSYEPDEEDLWDAWEHHFREMDWPVGTAAKVDVLPEAVRLQKIKEFEATIHFAQARLSELTGLG